MSLPVAVESLPFTGSTKNLFPLTALQAEQVWPTQAVPKLPQSVSMQQLPGTQLPPQQKSLPFAAQAPLVEQRALTQAPCVVPLAVSQIVPLP
ncbi:MAG TPA: hypothetical protein VHQ87_08340 [Rhizobacter sp.]|nr:hypothetical protein [Rhizobacter sp.]